MNASELPLRDTKKLGEVLIERGVLTRAQLDRALATQLVFGGHLGTCCIELGYLDELTLARTLAAIHDTRCARPEMFEDIPQEILRSLPIEEVRRRSAVPLGTSTRALHVAAIHSSHLLGLAALTGQRIVPYVAPEMSILAALEKYYGIPRRRRYLSVPYASVVQPSASRAKPVLDETDTRVEEPPKGATPAAPATRSNAAADLARRMSNVGSHAELGEVLLEFVSSHAERSILFDVEGEQALVANWRGAALERSRLADTRLPVTPRSVFGLCTETPYYRGPLPPEVDRASFYGAFSMPPASEVLVLPLYGECRLEAVLYADGERIDGSDETWLALVDHVALALRMLDCKRQLAALTAP